MMFLALGAAIAAAVPIGLIVVLLTGEGRDGGGIEPAADRDARLAGPLPLAPEREDLTDPGLVPVKRIPGATITAAEGPAATEREDALSIEQLERVAAGLRPYAPRHARPEPAATKPATTQELFVGIVANGFGVDVAPIGRPEVRVA